MPVKFIYLLPLFFCLAACTQIIPKSLEVPSNKCIIYGRCVVLNARFDYRTNQIIEDSNSVQLILVDSNFKRQTINTLKNGFFVAKTIPGPHLLFSIKEGMSTFAYRLYFEPNAVNLFCDKPGKIYYVGDLYVGHGNKDVGIINHFKEKFNGGKIYPAPESQKVNVTKVKYSFQTAIRDLDSLYPEKRETLTSLFQTHGLNLATQSVD